MNIQAIRGQALLAAVATVVAAGGAGAQTLNDLIITEVDFGTNMVEVTNVAPAGFVVPQNLFFCASGTYDTNLLSGDSKILSGENFSAGESKSFSVIGLNQATGDTWLFGDSNFTGTNILSGLQWGSTSVRTAQAVSAGVWNDVSDFAMAATGGDTLQLDDLDHRVGSSWTARSATTNAFFGTGTTIDPVGFDPFPDIATSSIQIGLVPLVSGITAPIAVVDEGGGSDRLYVVDQAGEIYLVNKQTGAAISTFLDVGASGTAHLVTFRPGFDERGLLGFALHPDFPADPRVFTYTSEPDSANEDFALPAAGTVDHESVVAEWQLDGLDADVVDVATRRELMRIEQPQFNHDAGMVGFGPDGYLYIALGDGGSSDDQAPGHVAGGNGQDNSSVLGSILRIDVDASANPLSANGEYRIPADNPFVSDGSVPDEKYAYGLRNPFRFSWNSGGDFIVPDVGQREIEEINIVEAGDNLGWRLKEGTFFFDPGPVAEANDGLLTSLPLGPLPFDIKDPVAQYDHSEGLAIIAGFEYRGSDVAALAGLYVTGDFSTSFGTPAGRLFTADLGTGTFEELLPGSPGAPLGKFLKGFGEDEEGEVYVCTTTELAPVGSTGEVFRITALTSSVSNWWAFD